MSEHGRITIYLAHPDAKVAHLDPECLSLRNRPVYVGAVLTRQATREGFRVTFRTWPRGRANPLWQTREGKGSRSARLCLRCGG